MATTKIKATAQLFLDTSNAKSDAKKFVADLKQQLSSIETAADKMTVFKDLVGYIGQVDKALATLRSKNPDVFSHMFDGLDTDLKKVMESIFDTSQGSMSALDGLRQKIKDASANGAGLKELRKIAEDVNTLFTGLGSAAPIDIDKQFTGRGKTADRVKVLSDALDNFALVWDNVHDKIKGGFGFEGTGSGSGFGGLSDQVQSEVDKLEKQVARYKDIVKQINDLSVIAKSNGDKAIQLDFKETEENARRLVDLFKELDDKHQNFLNNGDTESVAYYENIVKRAEAAMKIMELDQRMTKFDHDNNITKMPPKFLHAMAQSEDIQYAIDDLPDLAKEMRNAFKEAISSTQKQIDQVKKDALDGVKKQEKDGVGAKPGTTSKPKTDDTITNIDFTDLKNTIQSEAATLASKLDSVLKVELVQDDTDIRGAIDGLKATVDKISGAIDSYNSLKETSAQQAEVEVMKSNLTQLLKHVSDFNSRKINGEYQRQELSASLFSDGSISVGHGERGTVPWDRVASALVANLSKSLLVDIHSHPLHTLSGSSDTFVSDAFSGSNGDLAAFAFAKQIGAQLSAMITGNVLKTFDMSKLTQSQMAQFKTALADIERTHAKLPTNSKYVGYENNKRFYNIQDNYKDQHRVTEIFEGFMYEAFKRIGISKDKVDNEIFKQYDLTNESELTALAEVLVQMGHASQSALSPVEKLADIISRFKGDTTTDEAKSYLDAFRKGELSGADVFNKLNGHGYTINQDTLESLYRIDTANEISTVESMLTQIVGILNTISSSVSGIENQTRLSTADRFDATMNDIIDLRNDVTNKNLTAGIKSIFDPFNISEYKNADVLRQADASVLNFKDLLYDAYSDSLKSGEVDIDVLNNVLDNFKVAMSNVQDAIKQIDLYENRTGETVYDDAEFARSSLADKYSELTSSTNLEALLYMLSQAKLQIRSDKEFHDNGLQAKSDDVDDIGLVVGGLQQIQSTLESIYGVLHGFTGIEADTKNAVKYSKPIDETAATARSLSDQDISVLNSILQSVQDINSYLHTDNIDETTENPDDTKQDKLEESSIYQLLASKLPGNVASEDTLSSIRDMLGQLVAAATSKDEAPDDADAPIKESLGQLVVSLTSAVKGLQNATDGIIQHQKARKTDTSAANARIADKDDYAQIKDIALNSLGDRAIDSEVTEMKALANGIVQVIGYLQVAENEWEGFTLQVNEANEVSKLAFDKNSKAARRAAAEAEALRKASEQKADENRKAYSKEETARRAKVHLDEYTAQGKNATVQLKDSGRYTISILEEIGGLSKQVFQTFDENDEKIERTTATMSNKTLIKLQDLQKMIEFGHTKGFVGDGDDSYKKYADAAAELERLNGIYREQDSLSDEDIANWNTQIKLVQQLGSEVEKLVLKRKTAASSELFASERGKESSKFNKEYEQLKQSIAIPDSFTTRINDAKSAINNAVDNEGLQIAKNNWAALRSEIERTAIAQDLYIKKSKTPGSTKKSAYGTTPLVNAQAKFNTLKGRAQPYIDDGSAVVSDAMRKYEDAFERLVALQKKFKNESNISDEQKAQFIQLKNECNEYGNALKKIIDSSDKLHSNSFNEQSIKDDISLDKADDRARALKDYVKEMYGARAVIGQFNGDTTTLTFTVKNADGALENMTATLNAARTSIVTTSQGTKKASSLFGEMWNKVKGLGKYAAARFGVDEVFQALRSGIQDVRNIDSALTELKKVTNETDGAYSRFLQNMSKTAGVVGSTVADLTTMAAEWSRLGYSMEESATLAENTAILLNVSEFDNATEASEALISTMQAFQYTADESEHVVDILNEVGFKMPKLYSNI